MAKPVRRVSNGYDVSGASFRDIAGFVYKNDKGTLLRQVNQAGAADLELFMKSGLYSYLTDKGWLVKHKDLGRSNALTDKVFTVIQPQTVPVISYPFEWSFSQLQDAALLTLDIQKAALRHGMTLKDASAYNVQFLDGKPIFIDTLSFEKYIPGNPWQAYRQYCQHFLAPLSLMAYTDADLQQLMRVQIDGIRLDLTSKLLPRRAKLNAGIAMHIVLHGRAQNAKGQSHGKTTKQVSQNAMEGILNSLEKTTRKLRLPRRTTEWGDYYNHTNYSADAADKKAALIKKMIKPLNIRTVLDLGGNNGFYSRPLNELGIMTICTDIDPNAVEANYLHMKAHEETKMLPLLIDLTNPGGALGWQNKERGTITHRLQCDAVMALALIHHLAISNNLPFDKIAEYFCQFGQYLIIEFVPKADSQVQKMLATRKDIFTDYNETSFREAFGRYYKLLEEIRIPGTKRTLYLCKKK